jgi:hypothetical protein
MDKKREYLEEVLKQAQNNPDKNLQGALRDKTDTEKREITKEYLKSKEILMCVVQHDNMIDNDLSQELSLKRFFKDKPNLMVYGWSVGMNNQ